MKGGLAGSFLQLQIFLGFSCNARGAGRTDSPIRMYSRTDLITDGTSLFRLNFSDRVYTPKTTFIESHRISQVGLHNLCGPLPTPAFTADHPEPKPYGSLVPFPVPYPPLGQHQTPPGTTPHCSLRPCCCHLRAEISADPHYSLGGI